MAQPGNKEELITIFKSDIQADICTSGSGKLVSDSILTVEKPEREAAAKEQNTEEVTRSIKKTVNRCMKCRKRVGLSGGFRCRCGELYCGEHRYSDRHDCAFDYKKMGRERIELENPLIRAAKIVRI